MELVDDEFVGDSEEEQAADEVGDERTLLRVDARAGDSPERSVDATVTSEVSPEDATVQREDVERSTAKEVVEPAPDINQDGDVVGSAVPSVENGSTNGVLERVQLPEPLAQDNQSTQDTVPSATEPTDDVQAVEKQDERGVERDDDMTASETHVSVGPRPLFKVGDIVHVAARTWPGINKLGGAGKIASVIEENHEEDGETVYLYNVKYMLGGFEKRIEEEYIQDLATALETGARPVKERVFYHDEFSEDRLKKKRVPMIVERESMLSGDSYTLTDPQKGTEPGQHFPRKSTGVVLIDAPLDDNEEIDELDNDESDYEGDGEAGGDENGDHWVIMLL
ncbi:hypothetical protein ATCC90586_000940 [Pythium insidiosum]|nr:hypothetical protein ATCC90586_000940 [Pythium insidiosum]